MMEDKTEYPVYISETVADIIAEAAHDRKMIMQDLMDLIIEEWASNYIRMTNKKDR